MPTIVVNKTNAYTLWTEGLIAATTIPFTTNLFQTSPPAITDHPEVISFKTTGPWNACKNILNNVVLKGGFNAVRVFLDLDEFHNNVLNVNEHDIVALNRVGWDDSSIQRNTTKEWYLPRYALLAAQVDNLLTLCEQLGVGLILCPGAFYSGKNGALWSNQAYQDQLVNFWGITAAKWKNKSALIAYELINEPEPGCLAEKVNGVSTMTYDAMNAPGSLHNYKALMERCVTAIRAHDTDTPVMVSSIYGGNPDAMDYFLLKGLIADTTPSGTAINKVVYSAHFYNPFRYTHQGIIEGTYHSTGLCYPNFTGYERNLHNGANENDPNTLIGRDFRTNGMSQAFSQAKTFKANTGKPVFIGEFSACSSTYLKRISEHSSYPGAASALPIETPSRAVVGLCYDASTNEGVLVMKGSITLYDTTEVDALNRPWAKNTVNLRINAFPIKDANDVITGAENIGSFSNVGLLSGVTLSGNWYPSATSTNGDQNNLIRFAWPANVPVPSQVYGVSHLDTNGAQINPSALLDQIKTDKPQTLASIQIVLTDAQVAAQEASRVLYARDVLRECSSGGLSWAWYCEYEITDSYLHGDKFWQVDNIPNAATGTGGKLRALLKRAACQSYE